jgi:transcriptional regulator with XRE-family HTH domain
MAGENDRKIGKTIREIRMRQGMSQRDLARKLGMPQSLMEEVENGTYALRLTDVFFCAEALGFDTHDLMHEFGQAIRERS